MSGLKGGSGSFGSLDEFELGLAPGGAHRLRHLEACFPRLVGGKELKPVVT